MASDETAKLPTDWPALLEEHARANGKLLYSLAYQVLRDRTGAEDACQKVLLLAWERRDQIADAGRLKGWLARTVINESLAVLRRQKVERRVLKLVAAGGAAIGTPASVDSGDMRHALLMALSALDDDERAAVTLRVMNGLSGREVSAMLDVSDGQVSKLLHRGMEQLRITLAEWKHHGG